MRILAIAVGLAILVVLTVLAVLEPQEIAR